jgi:gluconolactonase
MHARTILYLSLTFIAACGGSGGQMIELPTDADVNSFTPPFSVFGEIERLTFEINDLIPAEAELELLAEGFVWSEGPVWVPDGQYLLFSDIPPNSIYRWSETDGISLFMRPSGYDGRRADLAEPGSNGLALHTDGSLLLAEHGNRRIARLESLDEPNGDKLTIADRYQGSRFNSPNDLIVAANGDIYFTDPPYGLAERMNDPEKELDYQGIYLIRSADNEVVLLAKQTRPNGIGLSPDERTLYVANSDGNAPYIYAYDLQDDGTLGARRIFFDAGPLRAEGRIGAPDGMTVDSKGNLWATGPGGVLIIDATGRHLGSILTGMATANCTFNEDESVLYITADSRLGRIRLDRIE